VLLEPICKFTNVANTFHFLSLRIWFIHTLTIYNWLFSLLIFFVICFSYSLFPLLLLSSLSPKYFSVMSISEMEL
jgi:hypothetical protein